MMGGLFRFRISGVNEQLNRKTLSHTVRYRVISDESSLRAMHEDREGFHFKPTKNKYYLPKKIGLKHRLPPRFFPFHPFISRSHPRCPSPSTQPTTGGRSKTKNLGVQARFSFVKTKGIIISTGPSSIDEW